MNQRFMDSEAEITHASSISPGSCYTHKISGVTNICCLIILTNLMFPLFVGLVSSGGNFGGPLLTPWNTTMLLIWKLILRI